MKDVARYDLGSNRSRWTTWVTAKLAEARCQQKAIAYDIAGQAGETNPKTSAVNRFVKGEPAEIQKWMTTKRLWLELFAKSIRMPVEELEAKFEWFRTGRETDAPWHPAFPDHDFRDVEIPSPLSSDLGSTATEIARRAVDRIGDASAATVLPSPEKFVVRAPKGRSRDIAAAQLRNALADNLRAKGWCDGERAIVVEIAEGTLSVEASRGRWTIVVTDGTEARGTAVHLRPWGGRELAALARRIAATPCIDAHRAQRLVQFAHNIEDVPDAARLSMPPDLVIWLLAEVANREGESNTKDIPSLLTAGAWRRAATGAKRLSAFDERLMEVLCSLLVKRGRSRIDVGGWCCASRKRFGLLLRKAIRSIGHQWRDSSDLDLLATIRTAKGRAQRDAAAEELARRLEGDPTDSLIDELVEGGILEVQSSLGREWIRFRHVNVASIWAARGTNPATTFEKHPEVTTDTEWASFIDEASDLGFPLAPSLTALASETPEASVDADLLLLRHAARSAQTVDVDEVRRAWASVLWAAANGIWNTWRSDPWNPWVKQAEGVLLDVSKRYRRTLPRFGERAAQIEFMADESSRGMVAAWARISTESANIEEKIRRMSPWQNDPHIAAGWAALRQSPEIAQQILVEEAERGDSHCRNLLSGVAWASGEPGADYWPWLAVDVRLEWAVRAGPSGSLGLRVLLHILRESKQLADRVPQFLDIVRRIGPDVMKPECASSLRDHQHRGTDLWGLPVDLAFAIAEEFEFFDVLTELAMQPSVEAPSARIRATDWGFVLQVPDRAEAALKMSRPSDQGTPLFGISFGVEEVLDRWESLAERAAIALHRAGHAQALEGRWRDGPAAKADSLKRDERRYKALLLVLLNPPWAWEVLPKRNANSTVGVPLEAFAAQARDDVPTMAEEPGLLMSLRPLGDVGSWRAIQSVGIENVSPQLVRAVHGVWCLLKDLPDDLPDEIDVYLDAVVGAVSSWNEREIERRRCLLWSERAARELVAGGDTRPIEEWVKQHRGDREESVPVLAAKAAVEKMICEDDSVLESAWDTFSSFRIEDPQSAADQRQVRDRLLQLGSVVGGGEAERQGHTRPLPFVVKEALTHLEESSWLTHLNGKNPSWLPVLLDQRKRATTERERAYWALAINQVAPTTSEVSGSLRWWIEHDPEPFSGGEHWRKKDRAWDGGSRPLLEACLARTDDWVIAGIERLLRIATELPISDETALDQCVLHASSANPWPLSALADALVARGRIEPVLNVWRVPPAGPAPHGRAADHDRPTRIRFWLLEHWLRHESETELRARLSDDLFRNRIAWALYARGARELEQVAWREATDRGRPDYYLLARIAPERLPDAFKMRLDSPNAELRAELCSLIESASCPYWENPRALLEARRALLKASGPGGA